MENLTGKGLAGYAISKIGLSYWYGTQGQTATLPDIVGILVFYDGHVGVYVGNGLVVEARGFNYGVCETKIKDRPWTKWGKHPLLTYNDAVKAVATPQLFTMPTIRKGDKGDSVKVLQKLLILTGTEIIVDGDFGTKTHVDVTAYQTRQELVPDGIAGAKTWGELLK